MNIMFKFIMRILNRSKSLRERLNRIEGKLFEFYIKGFRKRFFVVVDGSRFIPLNYAERAPDVIIKGNILEFIRMLLNKEDADSLLFKGSMEIEGEIDSLLTLKNALGHLNIWKSLIS